MSVLEQIKKQFSRIAVTEKNDRRAYINADNDTAKAIVVYAVNELRLRLSTISGVDTRPGVELLYHLAADREARVITVRTLAAKPDLEINSVTPEIPAAEWVEREIAEMLGVKFTGHPNLTTLLLSDDWPAGVYPLRKQSFESRQELKETEN
ncbi:MAG: NADH-quinone oxidoreductase subunit C [Candidatus Margulisbacteria bacterium]|jgi:Ni,Fe-hydrogenase III component G|nr:NADH-quinone oxidoreductase subunit C [Candidatus Margulisiibacteriota bacterium]